MKLVIDTNVLVAAFISRGASSELLEHCVLTHAVISSNFILDEFSKVLTKKFKYTFKEASNARDLLESRFLLVKPHPVPIEACRDKSDLTIIGTAISGKCSCIITGDKDLLILKSYKKIKMLDPGSFWSFEKNINT